MTEDVKESGVESTEVQYFSGLVNYARELEKMSTRRRIQAIDNHLLKLNCPENFQDINEAFQSSAKFEIHVNTDVIDDFIQYRQLLGTRFEFEDDLSIDSEEILYGSVRTYQSPKPFRFQVDRLAIEQAGLFFPLFPGVYQEKAEFVAGVCTTRGLASLYIGQQLKLESGQFPEMILVLSKCPDLVSFIEGATLPADEEYDARAFALRRRGIRVQRIVTV